VIGFDVPNPAHQAQLRCLAENTGGRYFNASDAASLENALGQLAVASTEKPLPAVPARLTPPANIVAATDIEIGFEGPGEARDWVGFAKIGSDDQAYLDYDWVRAAKGQAAMRAPAEPGEYELRYVSARRTPPVLARVKVTVAPATATVSGPKSVMAGDVLTFHATGPAASGHWIGFAPKGAGPGEYRDYVRPDESGKTEAKLTAPSQPGDYELRYVLNESDKVVAAQPIVVLPAKASFLSAPERIAAQTPIEVEWAGPRGSGHWIGVVPRGAGADAYLTYAYASDAHPRARFQSPDEPGDYDLVFVLGGEAGEQVILRQALRVD
jgi:Ca-activated chloride channel family protein